MKMKKSTEINVLGTKYSIKARSPKEDPMLEELNGYCDKTLKLIVFDDEMEDSDLKKIEEYKKKIIRHEIIHAFLYESGLDEYFPHPQFGHDETFIDWCAYMHPKIHEVYEEIGVA